MKFPSPQPGLVVRYSYLWKREHDAGRDEGSKDRPCAIVMAAIDRHGRHEVIVLPISHSPPSNLDDAIEIPQTIKIRLRLDSDRSWVFINESNSFVWPGPDLRQISSREASSISYGVLPPRFFAYVRDKFLERDRLEKSARVKRTD